MIFSGVTGFNVIVGAVALLLFVLFIAQRRRIPKGLRLPPGPPGRPIVGNITDMPKHHEWQTFTRWAKEYGDIIHLEILGQHLVCVNSANVAHELFETRSSVYSDRSDLPMIRDLMGLDWSFAFMRYSERWRRHRKAFHQHFHPGAVAAYLPIQARRTRDLLVSLRDSPNDFAHHFRHLAAATIMEITYDIKVLPKDDPYIETAEEVAAVTTEAAKPGAFLVDTFPILKNVPEWMPGAGFRRKARISRIPITAMATRPFAAVKQAFGAGTAGPSVVASLLEDLSHKGDTCKEDEEIIRNVGAVAYGAGSDTIVSAMTSFILAMALYPEVQRKAQLELNTAVGTGRLPTFEDRPNLPYINAICKEIYRWNPVLPLGVPHKSTQDDVYGDYFIPGGSIVFGNTSAILHDEKLYGPNPAEFIPERFFKPGVQDPAAAFGYGRRICPGRHMADNSLFITVACVLQTFDVRPAKDDHGNEIPIEPLFTSASLSHPEPFQCSITSRSASALSLIEQHTDG